MDIDRLARLRRDLNNWTIHLRDASKQLQVLKWEVVEACELTEREVEALSDDKSLGLLSELKDYVLDAMDEP